MRVIFYERIFTFMGDLSQKGGGELVLLKISSEPIRQLSLSSISTIVTIIFRGMGYAKHSRILSELLWTLQRKIFAAVVAYE